MSASIFGMDGVRGAPGEAPLDERTIIRLGAAVGGEQSGHIIFSQVLPTGC